MLQNSNKGFEVGVVYREFRSQVSAITIVFLILNGRSFVCRNAPKLGEEQEGPMDKTLERSKERNRLTRCFEWLTEAYERAQMRDHDVYVAAASNPREASQRLHHIEQGVEAFHV